MLILTYSELTPKCFPPLVKILCSRRKLSQSSIPASHFNHANAIREIEREEHVGQKLNERIVHNRSKG